MKFYFIETPSIEELQKWDIDNIWFVESQGVYSFMQRSFKKLRWIAEARKGIKSLLCPLFAGIRTSELQVYDIVRLNVNTLQFEELTNEVKDLLNKQFSLNLKAENKPEI